ncbi:MAG: class I SAM-dependent methyltransferase [Candidatus Omnitrophica bacterium]|nr:class I SAM-dependent methyltransferase [Candidatus Omnitrophota bacterium]
MLSHKNPTYNKANFLIDWLRLKEASRAEGLDDTSKVLLYADIIKNKKFLRRLYCDFYNQCKRLMPTCAEGVLIVELGSGGGFAKELMPDIVTSDIVYLPGIERQFSALDMPFYPETVDAFFMVNVFHHLNNADFFLKEVNRCLKPGGKLIMIEPANTVWSRFIWRYFHHEPFEPLGEWSFSRAEPLYSANEALPWIVFCRDLQRFKITFPSLKVSNIRVHTPLRYLLSGGLSLKQLVPSGAYNFINGLERLLKPLNKYIGMFMTVEVEKIQKITEGVLCS